MSNAKSILLFLQNDVTFKITSYLEKQEKNKSLAYFKITLFTFQPKQEGEIAVKIVKTEGSPGKWVFRFFGIMSA